MKMTSSVSGTVMGVAKKRSEPPDQLGFVTGFNRMLETIYVAITALGAAARAKGRTPQGGPEGVSEANQMLIYSV